MPGTASAIFATIRDAPANVIMISQASSEHSVCFAVKQAQGDQAVAALNARCASCRCRVGAGSGAVQGTDALPNVIRAFLVTRSVIEWP